MKLSLGQKFEIFWKLGNGLPLQSEYKFYPGRKWRFDYAIPDKMVAIELEGGVYTNGRHTRGKGYENDCEKYNAALSQGWKVFRLTTNLCTFDNIKQIIDNIGDKK